MRNVFGKIVLASLAFMLFVSMSAPVQAAEVKTSYFTLELPGDWIQPQATQEVNGMVSVVFANKKDGTAVSINVMPSSMSAAEISKETTSNMKKGGINVGDPVEKDGMSEVSFNQAGGVGMMWFGKECAVTSIIGKTLDSGKELIKLVKPVDAKLFPKF